VSLILTVHRGTHQIGGTCIEIQHASGERLILDAGRQLDAPKGANDIVPASLDRARPATVLISHPHQDIGASSTNCPHPGRSGPEPSRRN